MLYPPMHKLLKSVDNRYLLVNVVSRRARQISIESEREGIPLEGKPINKAIYEVADGQLSAHVKDEY